MNDESFALRRREPAAGLRRRVRLLGQPQLEDYLDFVREKTVDGAEASVRDLVDEWREANDRYHALETEESGLADDIEVRPLDPACAGLAELLRAEPSFAAALEELPAEIVLVELDKMVVSQLSVSLDFAEALAAGLGPKPAPEAVFRFCQRSARDDAPVMIQKLDDNRFLFSSESSDFRAQDAALLLREQVTGLASADPVSAIVGLPVGFGSNVLHAIRVDDRLILQNGYHRAYALRSLGLTHAVCAVQTVTRRDELKLVASDPVVAAPEFYCRAKRPPMLKDYFDPRIAKTLNVRRMTRVIEVAVEVREYLAVE